MKLIFAGLLTVCLALLTFRPIDAAEDTSDPIAAYRSTLEASGIKPTAEGILSHLTAIAPTETGLKDVDSLVRQLGATTFTDRAKAQHQLTALGILAESRVMAAAKSGDPEVMYRAEAILKQWRTSSTDTALFACFNALAIMKPDNGIPVILSTTPLCTKTHLSAAAEAALLALAVTNDLPALKQAIDKGGTLERCIVVAVYAKLLGVDHARELDTLLTAKAPQLRLATARALANLGLFSAASVFVDLLESEQIELRAASFACLLQFTKQDFKYSAYGPENERKEAVTAWRQWLAGDGKTAALFFPLRSMGSTSYLPPGHTLIAMGNNQRGAVEFNAEGKEVWNYPFQNCWTAERLANGNTLIASHSGGLIEVSPDKKSLWEFPMSFIDATPLENGNILATSQTEGRVIEIRKLDKAIVWEYRSNSGPVSAIRLPNGNTIVGTSGAAGIREVTPEKKELVIWSCNVKYPYGLQLLPNGNLLVADHSANNVFEWDRKAERRVWDYGITGPTDAFRTLDGNTLITNGDGVIEVTSEKKILHQWSGNNYGSARR